MRHVRSRQIVVLELSTGRAVMKLDEIIQLEDLIDQFRGVMLHEHQLHFYEII